MVDEIKVSICVVTYNQEDYIAECLQSLVDQKTDFPFEVIVGEDYSTDKTRVIIEDFSDRYPNLIVKNFQKTNVGPAQNILSSYLLARGKYICHMDGDDRALPGKIQAQSLYLDENSDCNVIWSRAKILDDKTGKMHDDLLNSRSVLGRKISKRDLLLFGSVACHSSKMFRAKTLREHCLPEHDFLDFYLDVLQIGEGYGCIASEFFCVYRSGVGISGSEKTKDLFLSNMQRLLEVEVDCRPYASANLLKFFLAEVKNGKVNSRAFSMFLKTFRLRTIFYFFRSLIYVKYFRSPI